MADAYDELLSQGEIQGHIAKVNLLSAVEAVAAATGAGDGDALLAALRSRALGLKNTVKQSKMPACWGIGL